MLNFPNNLEQDFAFEINRSSLRHVIDFIVSGMSLFLLGPILLFIAFIIKLTSMGPALQSIDRLGKHGRPFKLYKFRTTYSATDQQQPASMSPYCLLVTPIGRFLRRTKMDELPELVNVFRGEMSLVGPRPTDPQYVEFYTPQQRQVLMVRPGIISPAALHYLREKSFLTGDSWEALYRAQILPHRLNLDLAYLQRRTVGSDLLMILQAVVTLGNGGKYLEAVQRLRNRHLLVLDLLALLILPAVALTLRLDGLRWWPEANWALIFYTIISILVKLPFFYCLGLYRRYWRYAEVSDVMLVLGVTILSTITLSVIFIEAHPILAPYRLAMYRAVPLIDGLLTCLVVGGIRFGFRGLYHWCLQYQQITSGRRVLVVGAGDAGTMVVREIRANLQHIMEPVAFVDDDPTKIGTQIQGLPVLGTSKDIPNLIEFYQVQRIIVAMPSAPFRRQREIMNMCEELGVTTHSLPGVYEILAGHKTISNFPKIDIHRLLHRNPAVIDPTEIGNVLRGAKVLVTGAGGSIGSELCRQIARLNPTEIILLGHGENSIFEIGLDLRLTFPNLQIHQAVVDVRDQPRVDWVIEKYRPNSVFHAAAHKHVNLMEGNVNEAITNNIAGTRNVLEAAERWGVERFVLISTDKAVNPTSIMGATKRMAELLVIAAAQRSGRAYAAVRFGNVLGSRGSVIPIFQQQIAAGGPLTITHPDMRRYFMTIPEAVQLVLQATVLGQGGEVFVLDMGQPVRILDLAAELIRLSGLEPDRDIKIVYSGIRPGEKLNEELFLEGEQYQRTKHPKIFVATPESTREAQILEQIVVEFLNLTKNKSAQLNPEQMRHLLLQICYYLDQYHSQLQLIASKSSAVVPPKPPPLGSLYSRPSTSIV